MNYAELKSVATRWMQDIWKDRNMDSFESLHSPDFTDGSPADRASDRESYRRSIEELFTAFPDWQAQIDELVIEEATNKAAIRWSATGTHAGKFLDVEPSGKQIAFTGIEIIHIQNMKIIRRWGEWNGLEILNQLQQF